MFGAKIVGIGVALPGINAPGRMVTNDTIAEELLGRRSDLVSRGIMLTPDQWEALPETDRPTHANRWKQFETDDEWIVSHTGISTRPIADPSIAPSDLGTIAGTMALESAGWNPGDVDLVLVATVWPDNLATPPTAARIQHKLQLTSADGSMVDGFDIGCACSSFGKALKVAYTFIRAGMARRVLVIGADVMSRTVHLYSRNILPILADAGGAIALEAVDSINDAFLGPAGFLGGLNGALADLIVTRRGGTAHPLETADDLADPFDGSHRIAMDGGAVRKQAERILLGFREQRGVIDTILSRSAVEIGSIDLLALHQANLRINEPIGDKLVARGFGGIVYHNVHRYGNTTSASIPLVLYDAWRDGSLVPGNLVLMVVFGGGFSWESSFFRWTLPRTDSSIFI